MAAGSGVKLRASNRKGTQQDALLASPARQFSRPRRGAFTCRAQQQPTSRAAALRALLAKPDILKAPCCHDGLSARLVEQAGFPAAFMSGFSTAAARLGAPDTGLLSYAEVVDQGRYVHEATGRLPVIGDADTGYGNAVNVKRTLRGFAAAGFAGILIEDQVVPKSCGHVRGKRVAGREEAVARIRAAVDARAEGGVDILIVARSDARQADCMQEALWRAAAFADAGADMLFIDALGSEDEMRTFCQLGGAAARLPKMANMLEGGGKTPLLPPAALQELGFSIVAYPLSLLGVSDGRIPGPEALPSFEELQRAVGFPEYYAEEARYAVPQPATAPLSSNLGDDRSAAGSTSPAAESIAPESPARQEAGASAASAAEPSHGAATSGQARQTSSLEEDLASLEEPASQQRIETVEPDAIIPSRLGSASNGNGPEAGTSGGPPVLRVRITNATSGAVRLDTRFPLDFLPGLAAFVPQVRGVDVTALVRASERGAAADPKRALADFEANGERIELFLEA
ncbi:hypothetical protein WJX81_006814 [Elliptochloris bilobata]|uniref:Isocitrate lyase n=1 Tax=Elliptochloris bilobata TaxID=381761 RepID=A0AAW1RV63_9CHLO